MKINLNGFVLKFLLFGCMTMAYPLDIQKRFDWSLVINVPSFATDVKGNQIFHFSPKNKTPDPESQEFIKKYLSCATQLTSDAAVLKFASEAVTVDGAYLEMGVCTGKTINFIAALNPLKTIQGFDSFEGLPEKWDRQDVIVDKGTFGFKNQQQLPVVLHNVVLYKGWFKDVLPEFKSVILKDTPIALLHIDSDIYSAAKTIFDVLGNNIVPGTIIVFDELYNYPNCFAHEKKAFDEFLLEHNLDAQYLAYNINHEQVAVRIIDSQKSYNTRNIQSLTKQRNV